MLGDLFAVMMETPMLMVIFVVDLFLIFTIFFYVLKKIYKKKRPGQNILAFFNRFRLKMKKGGISSVEALYDFVVESYVGKGKEAGGYKTRKAILERIKAKKKPEEYEIVKAVFDGYEMKKYGGGVYNEATVVSNLFNRFRSL